MRGAVDTLRFGMCVWAVVMVCAGAVSAQTLDGQNSQPRALGYLSLDRLDAYLELKGDYSRIRVRTDSRDGLPGDRRQKNRARGLEERIGFQLSGDVIDPGFISFGGDFSFALTQDRFEEKIGGFHQTDTDRGYLLQYDLRLNLFSGKRLSGSVYGLRQDDRINRQFQPTLDQRRTGLGTSWTFAHDKFPMELSYDYLDTDRTGNADSSDDEHFTESTLRYGASWLISDGHRFKLSYEHGSSKQEYQGLDQPFETDRDLLTLEHELEFGPSVGPASQAVDDRLGSVSHKRNSLRTLLHWQEESGDFARDLFEIGPQLTLQHGDSLQTMYKYQYDRDRYQGMDVQTHRADFQLVHQLYSNLTTAVDVFGLYEDIEADVQTTQYGASIDWQYNRKNRWGHLYANLSLAYDREDVTGDNGRRIILDEAVTFRDPAAATLRNRNIISSTIVVTDATNRRVLQPGVDYLVITYSNATRLLRVRNGRIADGDTVLVDYQFNTPAHGRLDTVRVDLGLEQRFSNGLTPYYRLSYRDQQDDVSTGFARRADRTDHHRLGVTYEAKRFSLGAEAEIFDDTIDPYDAFHINGALHMIDRRDHSLDASTRLSRLYFEGGFDDRNVTMIDVELGHRWRLTEALSTVERFSYRFEDDSVAGDTHGWDVTAGIEYVVGDLSGELTFEYDRLKLPGSSEEGIGVYFRLRRDIRNVFARW